MKALLFFVPLFRAQWRGLLAALGLAFITLAAGTALLGVSGWFLTATALTALGLSFNLFAPSAAVRGFSLIRIVSRYFEKLLGHNATLRLLSDLRRWLFGALFPRLPLADRSLRHGDLVARLTADVDALDTIFLVAIGPLIAAIVVTGAVTGVLSWLLPAAAWIYLAGMAVAIIAIPSVLVVLTRNIGTRMVEVAAELRAHVLDAMTGHDDVMAFGQAEFMHQRFSQTNARLSDLGETQALATSSAAMAVQVTTGLALLAILFVALVSLQDGALSGPVMAGIVFAIMGSFEVTGVVVRSIGKLSAAIASAERLRAIATAPVAILDPQRPDRLPEGDTIRFEAVTFAYGEGEPVLENASLTVKPGEHVAIFGPNGSGKSTVLGLLLRLSDPQHGSVSIGGMDIRDVKQSDLHRRIALLGQDSPVFLDTVRNNLLIAAPEATDAELYKALTQARLTDTIRAMPRGLDTVLGETGKTLSTGQARRLCLARVLLTDAGIIALDEPTAGLDRETELAFLSDLPTALAGRTVILATHADLPENTSIRKLTVFDKQLLEDR